VSDQEDTYPSMGLRGLRGGVAECGAIDLWNPAEVGHLQTRTSAQLAPLFVSSTCAGSLLLSVTAVCDQPGNTSLDSFSHALFGALGDRTLELDN
jgi:hypothetical protein